MGHLNEDGTISVVQGSNMKLGAPHSTDAELCDKFKQKYDHYEAYTNQVRENATLRESLFLKGNVQAFAEWLDTQN